MIELLAGLASLSLFVSNTGTLIQLIKNIKEKNVESISLAWITCNIFMAVTWTLYSLYLGAVVLISELYCSAICISYGFVCFKYRRIKCHTNKDTM